jgi:hypothetical protein
MVPARWGSADRLRGVGNFRFAQSELFSLSTLGSCPSAIDGQQRTGHKSCFIGTDIANQRCNLFRLAQPTDRLALIQFHANLFFFMCVISVKILFIFISKWRRDAPDRQALGSGATRLRQRNLTQHQSYPIDDDCVIKILGHQSHQLRLRGIRFHASGDPNYELRRHFACLVQSRSTTNTTRPAVG